MRNIDLKNIKDDATREALAAIKETLEQDFPLVRGDWNFYEFEVKKVGADTVKHNLQYTPKDFIITYNSAGFSVDYSTTNGDVLGYTATSTGIVRGFLGRYEEEEIE